MKCPHCGAWTTVKETRINEETNQVWRRKECANLHTFTTIELVPAGNNPRPRDKRMVAVRPRARSDFASDAPVNREAND